MVSERDLRVSRSIVIPVSELTEVASRSAGPGGQHVNKTNTRITLRWCLESSAAVSDRQRARLRAQLRKRLTRGAEIVVYSGRFRSQARNREAARQRLAELIAGALQTRPPRVDTKPTAASKRRMRVDKQKRAKIKQARSNVSQDDGN